ncbi:TerB family tellurite resistance protein [Inquilinus sp. Marseille-Q2685]|uniref:TerB family tellurite resistance protein n=1 Tax=Inquilinus sp. Marseille-Q2685 TaxID=2866581 RepID=UPI001CE3DC68|nr:TerB family tellurite resistance protein [Inquilinus sp. Marseille-Q2685]
MSGIWGKIVGAAAGLAIGGPIGALLGAVAGHAVDWYRGQPPADGDATQHIAFTIGVIALGAKMAKADGAVTAAEVTAFRQVFRVPPEEEANVERLFNLARRDSAGFEPYARQLAGMFKDRPEVLEELLQCLFTIAKADGDVKPAELDYLRAVSGLFGLAQSDFHRLCAEECAGCDVDPYGVLGVEPQIDDESLKAAYRRLIREHHPDRLVARGMPADFIAVATDKMARINAAYDIIRRERKLA